VTSYFVSISNLPTKIGDNFPNIIIFSQSKLWKCKNTPWRGRSHAFCFGACDKIGRFSLGSFKDKIISSSYY